MKLVHLADLHIGKIVNEFSMLEDQKYILNQIIDHILRIKADGVLLAGDIYDRAVPTGEAVELFDSFLTRLEEAGIFVCIITGNHDSPQRLGFADKILKKRGIYIETFPHETLGKVTFYDDYGPVNIYMLPFARPSVVRYIFQDETVKTYEDSVRRMLKTVSLEKTQRNILMTHHFVVSSGVAPQVSESEDRISIGGTDQVDVSCFEGFDYVALGHLHGPQSVGRKTVRYGGSPLKYSFSETFQKKSITVIEMKEKGNIQIENIPLTPKYDMRKIKGRLRELIQQDVVNRENPMDYLMVTLTDRETLIDPIFPLRNVYPNIMQLVFEKNISTQTKPSKKVSDIKSRTNIQLFQSFYEEVTGEPMDEKREEIVRSVMDDVLSGGGVCGL